MVKAPMGVSIQYVGPRTVDIQWMAGRQAVSFLIYRASERRFQDAQLMIPEPIPAKKIQWSTTEDVSTWIAIQALDAQGNPSDISEPAYVQLPPA